MSFGTNPLQNVFTTIATLVVVPFNVTELGTILQVMLMIGLEQVSCTVPENPVWPVNTKPNIPLPPGTVFTVEELPDATEMITGAFPLLNVAVTAVAAVTVTTQVPVPEHPPPVQPVNVEPSAGNAVSVTTWALAKFAVHVVGQLIPTGALVTVPVPVPISLTESAKLFATLKVAVTVSDALIVTVQVGGFVCGFAGEQLSLKLVNAEPEPATAVSTTGLFPAKTAEQVVGQLIPAGELVTVPDPLTATVRAAPPAPDRLIVCILPAVGPLSVTVIVPV
jgi:hypothetical protein